MHGKFNLGDLLVAVDVKGMEHLLDASIPLSDFVLQTQKKLVLINLIVMIGLYLLGKFLVILIFLLRFKVIKLTKLIETDRTVSIVVYHLEHAFDIGFGHAEFELL